MERKTSLCLELLDLANIFEPGSSHFRGKILLDLQETMALQAKREYDNGLITKNGAQVIKFNLLIELIA